MDSVGQIPVFFQCLLTGFIGGIGYEIFFPLRVLFGCEKGRNKGVGIAIDVVYFTLFSAVSVFGTYWFRLPDYRIYMTVGIALGGIIYSKTLRIILAFLEKVCYNTIRKVYVKQKREKKRFKNGEEKV